MHRRVKNAAAPSGAKLTLDRRPLAFALSAAIHAAVLAVLLLWHLAPSPQDLRTALTVVDLPDRPRPEEKKPPPPPPPPPDTQRGAPKRGDQGAPGKLAEAAPLASAIPVEPPKYIPAPVPGTGLEASSGAAPAGTGTGAGGAGQGSGGGGTGSGGGSPPIPRPAVDPQVIAGSFRKSDYPKELRAQGPTGTTWAEVIVGTNGRVTSCRVSRPSGIPQFDAKTCQILFQRFRYRPARDAAGKPMAAPDSFSVDWDYVDLSHE